MDTPKELLDKAKQYANSDTTDYFANVSKGTLNGAITGAVIGGVIGYYKHWNKYGSILGGLLIGGAISNLLIKYKN